MTAEVFRIKQELEKDENFRTIKNPEQFAEKIHSAYYNKLDPICEIRKASLWLMANPTRSKKNYSRFLANWFSNALRWRS